jgi:hypothetical protein
MHDNSIHDTLQHAVAAMEKHVTSQGGPHMDSKIRVGLDIGIILFIISLSFNAGIEYSKIQGLEDKSREDREQIDAIRAQQNAEAADFGQIKQSLIDIRDSQRRGQP